MDIETRHEDTKLYTGRRNKNEGTENGGHKKSSKIWRKVKAIGEEDNGRMYERNTEKEKKWRRKQIGKEKKKDIRETDMGKEVWRTEKEERKREDEDIGKDNGKNWRTRKRREKEENWEI